ncbi:MAG: NADH:ubiquinone reductase (Na(+)-transporting) subunit C [Vicingaceae bacterium]|jgi:Na+-transporting NADH:ubiquinone oxidoreductase subunit C|nr:NADH:ubiquinone reductase (Na(+)-transporting) subunit C [Flavobacteriales bacterium]MBQ19655.1 NADH:ubiquinone reductase (Na(+)-transporting) subunit C [Flavobacteriales bacterium]MDF1676473.1 NADH:ubiquinone reductase (Na(+)-transporting) subunit C [Vicingaceae bacterium]|tara:strand:+ start:227558 stop:228244 length:687 start_codon:yes stop_codon:yes gene_type:complete
MDVNSNKYTIGFSIVMVVIVALLLAFASEGLKPMQNQNIEREKMQNILKSVGIEVTRDEAKDAYNKYITEEIVLNDKGEQIEGDAFKVDVLKEYKSGGQKNFPIYIYESEGSKKYIIPLVGKGLWGPIWGYIALEEDKNTVAGASFDHKGETPGLGAEINQGWFQEPFVGKKIFDESGNYQSIKVIKGGAPEGDKHGVDAISGGTITGNGVTEMLVRTLKTYEPYLKS